MTEGWKEGIKGKNRWLSYSGSIFKELALDSHYLKRANGKVKNKISSPSKKINRTIELNVIIEPLLSNAVYISILSLQP